MGSVRGAVPVAVVLMLSLGAVGLLGFSRSLNPIDAVLGRGAIVSVPDVVESARPRAIAELEAAGLEAEVSEAFSLEAPRGTVASQQPSAGKKVREGTAVRIVISRGANRVEMPDAVGRPLSEVRKPFDAADIPIKVDRVPSERVAKGIIMEQSPGPGIRVTGVDEVSFVVSAGPADRPVPETAGKSLDAAAFELGRAGMVVGEVQHLDDPTVPVGAVVSSTPAAGTIVPIETDVDLVVSNGPAPVAVPDVVNERERAALDRLSGLGYAVTVAGRLLPEADSAIGAVFEQFPAAGTMLRPGQSVTIVVGRPPPAPLPPPPSSTTTSSTSSTTSTTTTTAPRR